MSDLKEDRAGDAARLEEIERLIRAYDESHGGLAHDLDQHYDAAIKVADEASWLLARVRQLEAELLRARAERDQAVGRVAGLLAGLRMRGLIDPAPDESASGVCNVTIDHIGAHPPRRPEGG